MRRNTVDARPPESGVQKASTRKANTQKDEKNEQKVFIFFFGSGLVLGFLGRRRNLSLLMCRISVSVFTRREGVRERLALTSSLEGRERKCSPAAVRAHDAAHT